MPRSNPRPSSAPILTPEAELPARPRRALITGGARGLGRAFALDLARAGWDVAVIDRDLAGHLEFPEEAASAPILDALQAQPGTHLAYPADVTDPRSLYEVMAELTTQWGTLDALVCNAGGGSGELLGNRASTMSLAELRDALERNLVGTVATVQAALPLLSIGDDAAILTMSSLNGLEPTATGSYAHYGVAKAAVAHYSRYLARDLGPQGIRVNCLAPGPIATGRLVHRMAENPTANASVRNALGRIGTVEDVVPLVRFLLSPEAGYLTGQVIRIDGGL
ncbi:3-oxoacyl-[acyl-carrier protein] reductase [Leucobacter sp. 7(1)]|uniref:SDR family NAD(P)-dependent oxidoreductase n=1 Tax=Leucobacter sp. 7(1) TaxID=1255613 RepID=UPI00097E9F91|nr:SDR family oxidoreductase [Leucobacter sp. 7(1)]SJN09132.1 3-oxoacyl-[acyl-carrier protein] reductase [Leucobacter sp. 7(1)]